MLNELPGTRQQQQPVLVLKGWPTDVTVEISFAESFTSSFHPIQYRPATTFYKSIFPASRSANTFVNGKGYDNRIRQKAMTFGASCADTPRCAGSTVTPAQSRKRSTVVANTWTCHFRFLLSSSCSSVYFILYLKTKN